MANGTVDVAHAAAKGPLRRIPAHAETVSLSCSTVAQLSSTALDDFVAEVAWFSADGGEIGVTIAASASGVSVADCLLRIADGESEELFISSEDASTGLVYVSDTSSATLRIGRPKPYGG